MIEIINLCKSFGNRVILDNLNLVVDTGQTTVVIGRSGCGKSVLLKHIVGLIKPDSGQVLVDGQDITKLNGKELRITRVKFGVLFQSAALFDSMTIGENVGFPLQEHTNFADSEIASRVKECLEMVGLRGVEEMYPSELSGGMKKRVGLARAICMRPQIVLYDEPTTGVDPIMGDAVNDLIVKLHDQLRITSIAVTHDMVSAYKIADKIGMLYQGKIIEAGTPKEIQNTANPIVRQFITGASKGPLTQAEEKSYYNGFLREG